jgi:hypothetical protein
VKPKILLIDVESAPVLAAVFPPLHETNAVWVERGTYLYCFAAQWLGETDVQSFALPDYKRFRRDIHNDKSLCQTLHSMLSECDVAIGHNARAFDIKLIRARLIIHNFPPLPPFKVADTLTWARSIGKFDSNRLNALGEATGLGQKIPTKNDLWRRCYHGDKAAFQEMREYCAQDVALLAAWYNRIAPWTTNHPNLSVIADKPCCPVCQSVRVQRRGFNLAKARKRPRFQCQPCGHWFAAAA